MGDAERWDDQCRRAWCRYHGDKREKAVVAAEFGVKITTIDAMLDRGKLLCQPPEWMVRASCKQADADDDEDMQPEDRIRRFRAHLRLLKGGPQIPENDG